MTDRTNCKVRLGSEGFSDEADTQVLEQLPFSLESTLDVGTDPYSNDSDRSGIRKRRRTLDDMRELDQQIKQARVTNGQESKS